MSPVGDLDGARRAVSGSLTITTPTIACDDADAGMSGKPCRNCAGVSVWEMIDDPSPFKITDQGPVSQASLPGPVVDPDDAKWSIIAPSLSAHGSKRGIAIDRQYETPYEPRSGASTEGKAATMNDAVEAACAPGERLCDIIAKRLDKSLAATRSACTPKPSDRRFDRYGASVGWKIGDRPAISAMNAMRPHPTTWAVAPARTRSRYYNRFAELLDNPFHD